MSSAWSSSPSTRSQTAWGGPNTLAQAPFSLREERGADAANKILAKLCVYTSFDQDDSGAWMRREFPTLFYILSPRGCGGATWTRIHQVVPVLGDQPINEVISNRWLAQHIVQGHGLLGGIYPRGRRLRHYH